MQPMPRPPRIASSSGATGLPHSPKLRTAVRRRVSSRGKPFCDIRLRSEVDFGWGTGAAWKQPGSPFESASFWPPTLIESPRQTNPNEAGLIEKLLKLVRVRALHPGDSLVRVEDNLQAEARREVDVEGESVDSLLQIALLVVDVDCAVTAGARYRLGDQKKMVYRVVRDRPGTV